MMQEQIDACVQSNNRLAAKIIFGMRLLGRPVTRGEIVRAFEQAGMRPTRGQLSDALQTLAVSGLIDRTPGASGYLDFNDCVLTLI